MNRRIRIAVTVAALSPFLGGADLSTGGSLANSAILLLLNAPFELSGGSRNKAKVPDQQVLCASMAGLGDVPISDIYSGKSDPPRTQRYVACMLTVQGQNDRLRELEEIIRRQQSGDERKKSEGKQESGYYQSKWRAGEAKDKADQARFDAELAASKAEHTKDPRDIELAQQAVIVAESARAVAEEEMKRFREIPTP